MTKVISMRAGEKLKEPTMAYVYKRIITIFDGPHDSDHFYNEDNAREEEGSACLDPYNLDAPQYTVEQFCVRTEEMDDEYSEFSPSFIRLNGTKTVYWSDSFDASREVIAKDFAEAGEDILALLQVACIKYGDTGELEGEFLDTGMGLEEGELRYPVDYNNSIEFDEAQLENFDLDRFYAITVWYEKAEIDDALVRFIPESAEADLEENQKEGAESFQEFLRDLYEPQIEKLPVFATEPDFSSIAIYTGDVDDIEFDSELTTFSVGYITTGSESDDDFEEDED